MDNDNYRDWKQQLRDVAKDMKNVQKDGRVFRNPTPIMVARLHASAKALSMDRCEGLQLCNLNTIHETVRIDPQINSTWVLIIHG